MSLPIGSVLAVALCPSPIVDNHISDGEFTCYFGNLHAHCVLSPDFQPQPNPAQLADLVGGASDDRFDLSNGPIEAWREAAVDAKLDFMALTEHLHGPEQAEGEPCSHEMPRGGYRLLLEAAERMNSDPLFQGKFLAIPGIEWSSISKGNHVNIFFARAPVPDQIANGAFRNLLGQYLEATDQEAGNPLLLAQMNHPNGNDGDLAVNYGRDEFPDGPEGDAQFAEAFGRHFVSIEHINSSASGVDNPAQDNQHRDGNGLGRFYHEYLNRGFRLAPVGDHDNHRANWGRSTAARTGVWARELTPEGFVEAMRAHRAFATEDNELAVAFKADGHWMGSIVGISPGGTTQSFTVSIDQIADTDSDEVLDEGPYIVELFGDEDGPGGALAARVRVQDRGEERSSVRVEQGGTVEFSRQVTPGSYYYVHVRETNGQDAGGNDADAWTAPIWFTDRGELPSDLSESASTSRSAEIEREITRLLEMLDQMRTDLESLRERVRAMDDAPPR